MPIAPDNCLFSSKQICQNIMSVTTETKIFVSGIVAGAVGASLYYAIRSYHGEKHIDRRVSIIEPKDVQTEEDSAENLKIDLQSLASESETSIPSKQNREQFCDSTDFSNVIEMPLDIRALLENNQKIVLQIRAIELKNGLQPNKSMHSKLSYDGYQRQQSIASEMFPTGSLRNQSLNQFIEGIGADGNEMFESESIRRLDGAIGEVNFMLQRLGSMLERTRIDISSRRPSVDASTHGTDRRPSM